VNVTSSVDINCRTGCTHRQTKFTVFRPTPFGYLIFTPHNEQDTKYASKYYTFTLTVTTTELRDGRPGFDS